MTSLFAGRNGRSALVLAALAALLAGLSAPALAQTLPSGGTVASGNASIAASGANETVTQTSAKAIIDWQSFSISQGAAVSFQQPSGGIALNRVLGGSASEILGRLSANGQIFLINPAGITFGSTASVNVGGLVASTLDMADADFNAGTYTFTRGSATGAVVNNGRIVAASGGYVALLGPTVVNTGLVEAELGTVGAAAGDQVTLTFPAAGNMTIQVSPATVAATIQNFGVIAAPDGRILMTAEAADSLLGGAIQNFGTLAAASMTSNGGTITLAASSTIIASGTIDASGALKGGSVAADAPSMWVGGDIYADGWTGGGTVTLGGADTAHLGFGPSSYVAADGGSYADGGTILATAAASGGNITSWGVQDASAGLAGGTIRYDAPTIGLLQGAAWADGDVGGSITVGGPDTQYEWLDQGVLLSAHGWSGSGGNVALSDTGAIWDWGLINASGWTTGGNVSLEAPSVNLFAAGIFADGWTVAGGGITLGDASTTTLLSTAGTAVRADGVLTGNGGTITATSASSGGTTSLAGVFSAEGGYYGGAGGTVDTTGGTLNVGAADVYVGPGGTWLTGP